MSRLAAMAGIVVVAILIAGCADHAAVIGSDAPATREAALSTAPVSAAASRPGEGAATPPAEGRSWDIIALPEGVEEKTALRGVYFFDDKVGWAFGDKGVCLTTGDG